MTPDDKPRLPGDISDAFERALSEALKLDATPARKAPEVSPPAASAPSATDALEAEIGNALAAALSQPVAAATGSQAAADPMVSALEQALFGAPEPQAAPAKATEAAGETTTVTPAAETIESALARALAETATPEPEPAGTAPVEPPVIGPLPPVAAPDAAADPPKAPTVETFVEPVDPRPAETALGVANDELERSLRAALGLPEAVPASIPGSVEPVQAAAPEPATEPPSAPLAAETPQELAPAAGAPETQPVSQVEALTAIAAAVAARKANPPPDDREALEESVIEFVLGTLDDEERADVAAWAEQDPDIAALVQRWTARLGHLHELIDPIEPPSGLEARVLARLPAAAASAPAAELAAPEPVRPAPGATGEIVELASRVRRWRIATVLTGAMAASLVAFGFLREMNPEALPVPLRPAPQVQVVEKVIEKPVEKIVERIVERVVQVPAPMPSQFVAVLQADPNAPGFVLTIDTAARTFTARRVGAQPPANRAYELWIIHDTLGPPRSLGVIGDTPFTQSPGLSAYDPAIINAANYVVTLEAQGGSPTGGPQGPAVFSGRLVQTTP
jgi:anti-sigma-K factor RskA